jgi:hypothetical protein
MRRLGLGDTKRDLNVFSCGSTIVEYGIECDGISTRQELSSTFTSVCTMVNLQPKNSKQKSTSNHP